MKKNNKNDSNNNKLKIGKNAYQREVSFQGMVRRSAMSSGIRRGCSKALATYPALPCWKSLIKESIKRGDPFNTKGGFPPWTLVRQSRPLSTMNPSLEDLV